MLESARSLQSSKSASTKVTMDSVKSNAHFTVYALGGERVIGVIHATTVRLNEQDMRELRAVSLEQLRMATQVHVIPFQMRLFDANNINRFIGVSVDGPQIISVWRYCPRGTLGVGHLLKCRGLA